MLQVMVNDRKYEFAEGITILRALEHIAVDVPALCDDFRLKPVGACRLCIVEVKGVLRPVTACTTLLSDGMEIQTHTTKVEKVRHTNLSLLAKNYPGNAVRERPDETLHYYFKKYGISEFGSETNRTELYDLSHPYISVDMSKCIYCYRCVRICEELQGQYVWKVWNRGDRTRIFPDSGTNLLESSCVSCGACVDTCPSGALKDKNVMSLGAPTRWTRTTCPYCGVGCEMNVGTRQGKVISIKPVPDAPVSNGHLCVKGRYAFDFVSSKERVVEPMIRRAGRLEPVSWNEAIHFVAAEFQRIMERHGPDSIGVLGSARATNEENYLVQKFARAVLRTNNVDCCARVCHAPSAAAMKQMLGTGASTNSFDDIEQARTILLCGANATENHPVVGARIKQAKLRGANLVVIDPRRIELADYADVHLQLRPGSNVPLLNAMAAVIVEEKLFDESAVMDRIDQWHEFREFISHWLPEKMVALCDVDAELIRRAARLYATAKPSICFHGLGLTEHVQGTEGVMCLVNLALLTGNFGKAGTGINPLRGQNNVQGAAHMGCEPNNLTGYVPIEQARATIESVWGMKVPVRPGMNLLQMIDAAGRGLKAMWAIGYDIALTNPDAEKTRTALSSLEFLVVQDMFHNALSDYATVFLPAASSFEKDGTFMNAERRVQRVRRVIEPQGNSRPDGEIIQDIARSMGASKFFNFESPAEVWNEIRKVWKVGAGISYDRLEERGLQWPCPDENHPGTAILHQETFSHGKRACLRRICFHPSDETTSAEYPLLLTTGRTLYQFNSGTMTMRTPNAVLRRSDMLDVSPQDASLLSLENEEVVLVESRYGQTQLTVQINSAMKQGQLFATFHTRTAFVNELTSDYRDNWVDTPEYKITAVRIAKITTGATPIPLAPM